MRCLYCSTEYASHLPTCPICGTPAGQLERPSYTELLSQTTEYSRPEYTRKEFLNLPEMRTVKRDIVRCTVLLYIYVAIMFLLWLLFLPSGVLLAEAILFLILALCIRYGQSRIAAVFLGVFFVLGSIYNIISSGRIRASIVMLVVIYATISSVFRFNKAYKNYKKNGFIL